MKIVLVEPYFTGSHRAWAEGYAAASGHDVSLVTHEGRFWKWRMHGAPFTLATSVAEHVATHGRPDLLLASSMTNLAPLLGLVRRFIGEPTVALYMHENQLTYPVSPRDMPDAGYPMVNWTSMLAADLVLFNSAFHQDAWFAALAPFLNQFPDYRHGPDVIGAVAARSEVLPVGVDVARLDGADLRTDPPLVLWNQRCEYDKGPAAFVDALLAAADAGADFRVALAGERFVSEPSDFDRLRARLGDQIVHDGYADDVSYRELLHASDIVISTAHQEFFGIAITEAVYAGAFPLLPNRLVYPERIPVEFHLRCLYESDAALVDKLKWALDHDAERRAIAGQLRPEMARFDWRTMAPLYDERFDAVVADRHT